MEECPDPAGVIELPLADILGVVRPLHSALAMTKAAFPLTLIDSPSLIGVNPENKFIGIFEFSFESLPRLVVFEILADHLSLDSLSLILASL